MPTCHCGVSGAYRLQAVNDSVVVCASAPLLRHHATLGQFLNHTGTPRVPSDALPPPARVPGTHHSLHSATLALTARVCGACHALLLRQCPDDTCTHRERCVECTPRAGAARAHLCARAGSILGTWISDPVRITPQALHGPGTRQLVTQLAGSLWLSCLAVTDSVGPSRPCCSVPRWAA